MESSCSAVLGILPKNSPTAVPSHEMGLDLRNNLLNMFPEPAEILENVGQIRAGYLEKFEFHGKCFRKFLPPIHFPLPGELFFEYFILILKHRPSHTYDTYSHSQT